MKTFSFCGLSMLVWTSQILTACSSSDADSRPVACQPRLVSVDELLADLQGLSLDEFFAESDRQLMLRSPETITMDGLSSEYGIRDDHLDDISDAHRIQTHELKQGILRILQGYERSALSVEQRQSYDVYQWLLEDSIRGHAYRYHEYPITHWPFSVQNNLLRFFSDFQPVKTRHNAQDYVTRLGQIENKFACLRQNIDLSRQAGVLPLQFMLQIAADGIENVASSSARSLVFYTALSNKIAEVTELSTQEQNDLLVAAEETIQNSVIPAYQALQNKVEQLVAMAPLDGGAGSLPNGSDYYAYTLHYHTTTDMTASQIHQLGLEEVSRIRDEIFVLADQLGYPPGESLGQVFNRVAVDGGMIEQANILSTYEGIIAQAQANLDQAFDIFPTIDVVVIGDAYGGYYYSGTLDGSRPAAFYAYDKSDIPRYEMPTLAYHETVPGHHTQVAISQALDLPEFRKQGGFTAYAEGWALYAERLAKELGWYDSDSYADLGRLQAEMFRAVRLVVDTGAHAQHWSFAEAVAYFAENTGYSTSSAQGQIARYLLWPGQATAYKIGMLELLRLRQEAQDALGTAFDLKSFHRVVLGSGRMPLNLLEELINDYIQDNLP